MYRPSIYSLPLMIAGFFLALSSCASASGPLAKIGRFAQPPQIDGRGDDPCWKFTVSLGDFQYFGSQRSPAEGTSVCKIGYDDQALYFLIECEEPLFVTATQKSDEVIAAAKDRDGDVILDDSFMIILRPPGGEDVYEWVVNTRGVVSDARASLSDLWASRDLSWNSEVASAVRIEDGRWMIELAIPWKDLGKKPEEGSSLGALLSRIARTRESLSSWQATESIGAHAPAKWGELQLADQVPYLQFAEPQGSFQPGVNQLKVEVASAEEHSWLLSGEIIASSEKPVRASVRVTSNPTVQEAVVDLDLKAQGEVDFRWLLLDAVTLDPVYRSPIIRKAVEISQGHLQISTGKSFRLFLNGQLVKSGKDAANLKIPIPLQTGVNLLALEVESGQAELRIDGVNIPQDSLRWRSGDPANKTVFAPETDDSTWDLAPQSPGDSGNQQVGEAGAPRVLRHTILVKETKAWPLQLPALYIAGSGAQPVSFTSFGVEGKPLKNWKMFLETPAQIDAIGSSGLYGDMDGKRHADKARFQLRKEPSSGEKGTDQYVIETDRPILFNPAMTATQRIFQVFLKHGEENPSSETTYHLVYSSLANEGTVSELPQTLPVRLLPALNGKQPKKINWKMWDGSFKRLDDQDFRSDVLQLVASSGINQFMCGDVWMSKAKQQFGLQDVMTVEYAPWSIDLTDYLAAHPEFRRVDQNGKTSPTEMCLSAMLADGWEGAKEALDRIIEPVAPDVVEFDYEYNPLAGKQTCYCPICLEAFAEASSLDLAPLTPALIKETYEDEWVDFMAKRIAQLLRKMKDVVHEFPQKPTFAVYSGYQTPKNPFIYGINWKYVGDLQAADSAGAGFGRSEDIITATRDALQGIPLMCGILMNPYLGTFTVNTDVPVPPLTKALLLRRSLDGPGGVLIYERKTLDGRSWTAIAETTRLVADYEDLFAGSKLENLAGHDPASIQILKGEDVDLLCVLNESKTIQKPRITLPKGYVSAIDFYQNSTVSLNEVLSPTIPPGETAVYILHR